MDFVHGRSFTFVDSFRAAIHRQVTPLKEREKEKRQRGTDTIILLDGVLERSSVCGFLKPSFSSSTQYFVSQSCRRKVFLAPGDCKSRVKTRKVLCWTYFYIVHFNEAIREADLIRVGTSFY